MGAYATQWLKQKLEGGKWDAEATVAYANQAASVVIRDIGCQQAIPWASDLAPLKAAGEPTSGRDSEASKQPKSLPPRFKE